VDWSKPVARFEEALATIRALWGSGGELVNRDSPFFPLRNAVFDLPPYRGKWPEIWIAAHGPRMLRATGRYADAWFPAFPHRPQDYGQRLQVVRAAASDAGRDPMSILPAVEFLVVTGASRGAVEEALNSPVLKAPSLTASDEVFARPRRPVSATAADRACGQKLLAEVSDVFLRQGHHLGELPIVNAFLARERARRGDRDGAIPLMRAAVDHLCRAGRLLGWGIPATGVLVETLLDRGAENDVVEADAAIERLAEAPTDDRLLVRDILLPRLRALLAQVHGDAATYAHCRDRYRDMARTLEFDGHIAWAEALPCRRPAWSAARAAQTERKAASIPCFHFVAGAVLVSGPAWGITPHL
jgi:Luciferase-like monooxygenase